MRKTRIKVMKQEYSKERRALLKKTIHTALHNQCVEMLGVMKPDKTQLDSISIKAAREAAKVLLYPPEVMEAMVQSVAVAKGAPGITPDTLVSVTLEARAEQLAELLATCAEECDVQRQREQAKKDAAIDAKDIDELGTVLAKSLADPFDYALGLSDGRVIRYEQAKRSGQNHLILCEAKFMVGYDGSGDRVMQRNAAEDAVILGPGFPRGIEVRIDQIAWAVDAPFGS